MLRIVIGILWFGGLAFIGWLGMGGYDTLKTHKAARKTRRLFRNGRKLEFYKKADDEMKKTADMLITFVDKNGVWCLDDKMRTQFVQFEEELQGVDRIVLKDEKDLFVKTFERGIFV